MVVVLTATLYLSMTLSVFAGEGPAVGNESSPAQAAITKLFKMPAGTDTPTADFTFSFEKVSVNNDDSAEDLADMPAIADKVISYTAADAGTADAANVKSVPKESGNIVDGVVWPHAGVYVYNLSETANTYTITDTFKEQMSYSPGVYEISVYVQEGTNGYYVYAVSAKIVTKDNQDQGEAGEKVDVTPGGDSEVDGDYSALLFTNTYVKNNGTDNPTKPGNPTDPTDLLAKNTMSVSKTVAGAFGDKAKYFAYDVTVKAPAISGASMINAHKAYIVEENVIVNDIAANSASTEKDANGVSFIKFVSEASQTINLKHGQKLVFADLYVGSTFNVSEAATQGYTPSYIITQNGASDASVAADESKALGMDQARIVGEAKNAADFTNTFRNVTPTGISVDNLPFIALIVIAIGALAAYVVFKTRRRNASQGR